MNHKLTRRDLLKVGGAFLAYSTLAACAPRTTPAPEAVEPVAEKPATPVPAEPTKPVEPITDVTREQTLIIGFEGGPVADPLQCNLLVPGSMAQTGTHQAMIESLYYLNYQTGESIPWLAAGPERWNEDYTECTIPIREGVEWSDGVAFTAEDVAYTINLLRENPTLSYGGAMARWVEECTAPDPVTVRFVLTEANPRFVFQNFAVRLWGAVRIVPKHIFQDQDVMTFKNYDPAKGWPVWTGPYRLVRPTSTEFIYERRDDWWAAKTGFSSLPEPRRLIFVEQGDQDKRAAMLEANEVDGLPSLALEGFMTVRERNPYAIGWMEDPPYTWIDPCPAAVKFQCETPPWDDPDMRWAFAYAIDNMKSAELATAGYGVPARFQFPLYPVLDGMLDENADLFEKYDMRTYDPARSKEIIESKGYTLGRDGIYEKNGQKLRVDVLGVAPGTRVIIHCAYLKQVGIDAEPKLVSTAVYHDLINTSQFEIDSGWSYCGSVVDPWASFDTLHSKWIEPIGQRRSGNTAGFRNEEFDEIADAIGMLPVGDPRIKPLFRQGLEIWLRELPVFADYQQLRVVPYSTRYWTNWPTEKNDYFHPPNWWMCFNQVLLRIKPA